jgi:hypothetical protein
MSTIDDRRGKGANDGFRLTVNFQLAGAVRITPARIAALAASASLVGLAAWGATRGASHEASPPGIRRDIDPIDDPRGRLAPQAIGRASPRTRPRNVR